MKQSGTKNPNASREIEDLIMLEDSTHGTLCAIHKTINSLDDFLCSKHKKLKFCPVPKCSQSSHLSGVPSRSRRKSRSSSPHYPKVIFRALSANNDPQRRHSHYTQPHVYCRIERNNKSVNPQARTAHYVNIEKTLSCPGKMNAYNSLTNSFTSKSSIKIEQFTQNLMDTDEVVSELKGEIARVKHQLLHLSQQRIHESSNPQTPTVSKAPPPTPEDQFRDDDSKLAKLNRENKRLRRELDAKKKLLEKSKSEVGKAKDILGDYEKKVSLLHVQALKSSRAMRKSKETFCQCLQERETRLKSMMQLNEKLEDAVKEQREVLKEKELEITNLKENIESLKNQLEETNRKCLELSATNQSFRESIDMLKSNVQSSTEEVEKQKGTIQSLEERICDLNCVCKKVVSKTKKQKETYETLIKASNEEQEKMSKEISVLSIKVEEAAKQQQLMDELQSKCSEFQGKVKEYEAFSERCKTLEEDCKKQHTKLVLTEKQFSKEKDEMEDLISELTDVVKQHKRTISQMSDINKQQEIIIHSQSMALLTREEQLKLMEKESQDSKLRNIQLEQEVEELRHFSTEPCCKETCLCISRELEDIKNVLNREKDNHSMKEKIILDQSQTILNLQSEVEEKISQLNKAHDDTKYLEEEISKINEKLIKKHDELDFEIDEKEDLIEKLRILECQKNQLTEEIMDFEEMLHKVSETCGDNETQKQILKDLEAQITAQKNEWELQKQTLGKEKAKAVCAAKFATQRLLDTVADFQRQVEAQKKVQLLLTRMLHEKDEQLRLVTSRILSSSPIKQETKDGSSHHEVVMTELFFRKAFEQISVQSDLHTNTSLYSSCSSSSKRPECLSRKPNCVSAPNPCLAPCAKPLIKAPDGLNDGVLNIKEEPR